LFIHEDQTKLDKSSQKVEEKYLEAIGNEKEITDDVVDNEKGKVYLEFYQSFLIFSPIWSSVSYLYKLTGVKRPTEFIVNRNKFMRVIKHMT
jgi:hypothetical protein